MNGFRAVRRVLWITMGLNLVATAAKLVVGYRTGSLSLIADGLDSAFDAAANVIGLVGIYVAAQPPDKDHPYGHRKAETIAALIISSLLFLTTWELIQSAVERLRDPALIQAEVNTWSFGALILSIVVHLGVAWYELRAGRRLQSDVLVADAMHTRADVFVSLAVMGGLIAVRLGYPLADPILALVVALIIAKIGIDIIREGSPTLMDQVAIPPDEVTQIALSVPGVISCHQVRSRGHEGNVYADLHIQVDPDMSTQRAHTIAHEVQHRLRTRRPDVQDVTIHVEPGGSYRQEQARDDIAVRLRQIGSDLEVNVHDVWIYEIAGSLSAEIHLEAASDLPLREAHALASVLEDQAYAKIPRLDELTTHIEPLGQWALVPGSSPEEPQIIEAVEQVVRTANETWGPVACHRIQVRRSNVGWAVSMHCMLPGEMILADAHRISSRLEALLRERVPDLERVTIHTEPQQEQSTSEG
jgi:cation diffusion facilitator family transporter